MNSQPPVNNRGFYFIFTKEVHQGTLKEHQSTPILSKVHQKVHQSTLKVHQSAPKYTNFFENGLSL